MAFKFNQTVRHGRLEFLDGIVYDFKDPRAQKYFEAAGWGKATKEKAVRVVEKDEIEIDPDTTFADGPNKGQRVLEG